MERDMQQLMFEQDEETIELKETFSTLQQEVELKTKKLRKVRRNTTLVIKFIKCNISYIICNPFRTKEVVFSRSLFNAYNHSKKLK